ncbi:HD family hydrolase [Caldimonas sp. KR1-144]|uniref:HD family hydrolase n=1 Tax=Caldimonas sp. KR1-144 TaxID=3400911 RepID=UPI003C03C179
MPLRAGDWMQTSSGKAYFPADPRAEDIDIFDIAHALSNLCRYGGHCSTFYSVAEHSVLVSQVVPPELAMQALLHDATEAYLVDLPRPIKHMLPGYCDLEDLNWAAVAAKFGLPYALDQAVKDADNAVLLAEKEQLLGPSPAPWSVPGEPADVTVLGLPPTAAAATFLRRFFELGGQA